MSEIVLSLNKVSKSYENKKVLNAIDFSIEEGTIMGLVGKNGAGKSTMIKCLLGIIKADEGESEIYGEPSWNLSPRCKHRIGYVPQNAIGFGWMRVRNMMVYTGCFYDHWNMKKVDALIKEWDLDPEAKVATLSEGEKQKLAIIQAMGHEPDLFILDEPVAGLDPVARRQFIKKLIDLNIEEKKTVLFSTHITSDLERVAADVALLKDGNITFKGDLATLKDRVKKIRIQAQKQLPETLPIPNIIHCTVDQNIAVVTVDGLEDNALKQLETEFSAIVSVEHLNLEDIFLELNK
ncbi:MAG: ABC transporter ATP-binding protein [bacterium]|nr:ABC transporter ATP-binding protein [bacterium]